MPRDEPEHAVYEHAAARFHRDVAFHNVSEATCLLASSSLLGSSCSVDGYQTSALQTELLSFARLFPRLVNSR